MDKIMVSLTAPQLKWLRAKAAQLGVSVPELLRRIVDAARGEAR